MNEGMEKAQLPSVNGRETLEKERLLLSMRV